MRRFRLAGLVAVDLVASLALSACGGDSSACGAKNLTRISATQAATHSYS